MFDEIAQKYFDAFDIEPPQPFGITDDYMIEIMNAALNNGEPIPDDFDWWSDLPDGALA